MVGFRLLTELALQLHFTSTSKLLNDSAFKCLTERQRETQERLAQSAREVQLPPLLWILCLHCLLELQSNQ